MFAGLRGRRVARVSRDLEGGASRGDPRITLEELDGEEVVVRIAATPEHADDGPALASQVLAAVAPETRRVEAARDDDDG